MVKNYYKRVESGEIEHDYDAILKEYDWFKSSTQACCTCGKVKCFVFGHDPQPCYYCGSTDTFVMHKEILK